MSDVVLAILLFTLVPGSVALAAARSGPDEMYERAQRSRPLVVAGLTLAMLGGCGIPAALWYAVAVDRHRHAVVPLREPLLARWVHDVIALPHTVRLLRQQPVSEQQELGATSTSLSLR